MPKTRPPYDPEFRRLILELASSGRSVKSLAEEFGCTEQSCGGRRRVLAYVKGARGVRAILEHLGLSTTGASMAPARGPHKAAWC